MKDTLVCQKEWEERKKLYAKGNKLYVEGNKLYVEGNKLYAEGTLVFINAVIQHYGKDAEMGWNNMGCLVAGKDQYLN